MKPGEYITADTHWGHANIIKFATRPFADVDEMNKSLVRVWNAKVPKDALVYHLGDVAFGYPLWRRNALIEEVIPQLNGHIVLVTGNHDRIKGDIARLFEAVTSYLETETPDGTLVSMFHYPILRWKNGHYGSWHLHGHSHGGLYDDGVRRLDVGVDCHPNYEPFSYDEIVARMEGRHFITHHTQRQVPSNLETARKLVESILEHHPSLKGSLTSG